MIIVGGVWAEAPRLRYETVSGVCPDQVALNGFARAVESWERGIWEEKSRRMSVLD